MIRKPDNVIWYHPWRHSMLGWDYQKYYKSSSCLTIYLGIVTLRWYHVYKKGLGV